MKMIKVVAVIETTNKLNDIKYFVEGKYKFFPLNRYIKIHIK